MHPNLNFSEVEFVQLGLLPATSFVIQGQSLDKSKALETPLSQPVHGTPGEAASLTDPLDFCTRPPELLQSQGESLHQAAPQGRVPVLNDKKQANREHQRRFRERRKGLYVTLLQLPFASACAAKMLQAGLVQPICICSPLHAKQFISSNPA